MGLVPFASFNAALADLAAADADRSEAAAGAGTDEAAEPAAPRFMPRPKAQVRDVDKAEKEGEDKGISEAWKKQARQVYQTIKDKLFFTEPMPPIGSARLSYARLLQLLNNRMVKRLTIMADGQVALVEVPIHQGGHDYDTQRYNDDDLSELYVKEFPEWKQEMIRYYVDLPGDFWYNSNLHKLIKAALPHKTGDGFTNFMWTTQESQYVMEVKVLPPGQGYQWAAAYSNQILLVLALVGLRVSVGGVEWILSKLGKLRGPRLTDKGKLMKEMSKSIAKTYNVGRNARSTGVRFDDVQGIDHIKGDIQEILAMLLGAEEYKAMGAKVPRGVLLEGPPGTGKTYLARAMANEARLPFFSANGAEFVQMFQGVASARVRSLFKQARAAAPAIVFIDEVDAIGKARDPDGLRDAGSEEREQGLMQLLVEMDGFRPAERVLVVAATNRRDVLDPALLRPGRFDRIIHMGTPSPDNRLAILRVHSRGKQVPRDDDDHLLRAVAAKAVGYSGAELANLLNEAAILQVRYAKPEIDMEVMQEVMDKARVGLQGVSVPLSTAKRHLAVVWAGRAVGAAATAPRGAVESVSLRAVGTELGRILYATAAPWMAGRVAAGDFAFCVNLMVPLYSARATEEAFFGRAGCTLATAAEIAAAGRLAAWLTVHSRLNPAQFGGKVVVDYYNPATQYLDPRPLEELTLRIQTLAYHRALVIAHERRGAIDAVAAELLVAADETVPGARLYELLEAPPQEVPDAVRAELPFKELLPDEAAPEVLVEDKALLAAIGLVKGDVDPGLFFDRDTLQSIADAFRGQSDEWRAQRRSMEAFATDEDAPFPEAPDLKDKAIVV